VETHDGIVTLAGSVANVLAKDRAEKLAGAIKGVKSIVNNIEIKSVNRTDEQIQRDVENALLRNPVTETYEVGVEVEDNKVLLTGEVESRAEKTLAEKVAKGIKGIQEFENNIDVEYEEDRTDSEITEEIKRILETSVWIDEALIEVTTLNGHVTLSGTVGSALEKSRVYNAAWVAGVESVNDDNLEIEWWAHDNMRRQSKYAEKSDKEIKKAVKDAFIWDPRIVSFGIELEADNGIVALSGKVDTKREKNLAVKNAFDGGAKKVRNNLDVKYDYDWIEEGREYEWLDYQPYRYWPYYPW